ncbi:MAG TPA: hypothetical protein DD405_03180 [Desulfobacteraceae bacterium]|nr:hypothetical protein [Desulfobacteraceae bacterium]
MKQKKRESILEAAGKRFAKYGLTKTNIDEIARFARVAKATIYNYFGSKDNVYIEVLKREANITIEKISHSVDLEVLPGKKLIIFAKTRFQNMSLPLNIFTLVRSDTEKMIPEAVKIRDDLFEREVKIISSILNEGVEKGVFYVNDVFLTARAIGLALKGFERQWLHGNKDNIDIHMEELIKILFLGLKYKKDQIKQEENSA